ncbi:MAG: hypothetical protein AAY43_08535 [Methanosarcina sp. 795]|nr:MAG: hypothetical protein AAY43_08535 [Methanosarcina sp. 795]
MIPEDWKILTLENAMESIIDYRGKTPKKTDSGIPLITAKIVKNGRILEPNEFISPQDYESWMRRGLPKPGDVVITTEAPMGEVAQLDERKVALAQRLITLRGKKGMLHNNFLRFVLQSPNVENELKKRESGTTVTGIKQKELRKALLPIPPYDEQIKLSEILISLDNKIDLNHQMNSTLEQIAQTLFKHWFIDFEFPDENGNPYKSSGGRMVDSELGEIPEGWEVKAFSEVIDVNPIRRLSKGKIATKVSMADLNTWQSWINSWQEEEYKSGPKFKNGDTLFARITPSLENGKTAFVNFLNEGEIAFGSTEFIVFGSKVIESGPYIFCLSRSEYIRETAINAMTGTSGRQRVPNDCFDHLLICVPSGEVVKRFDDIITPLFEKIKNNAKECINLREARDSLLPKLMSGKIRVQV